MLVDDIFRVQLPLVEFETGQQTCLVWNVAQTIRIEAPMNPFLLRCFQFGQDHIYVRGQFDDVTKQLEARQLVEGPAW